MRITGPPGIGKTTFLRYVLASRTGERQTTLSAAAMPADRTRPGAWVLRALSKPLPTENVEGDLLAAILRAVESRTTVCIDDVQWLDEVSRRILRTLAHERRNRLTLLLTDRREAAPEVGTHSSVHLAPLRGSAAAQLVRCLYPRAPADVVSEIVATASGLPFDVVFLADQAAHDAAASADETEPSTAAAIARRLDRCSDKARESLRHCACLDPPVDLRTVARAMGLEIEAVARDLTEVSDLVETNDLQLVFRHAAIPRAILVALTDPIPYYTRLLAGFDNHDDRPEFLAARLRCASACGADDVAADCALRLGQRLAAASSLDAAADYLTQAVRYARRPLPIAYATEFAGVLQQLQRDTEAASFLKRELVGAIARKDFLAAAELLISFFSAALTLERFAELETLCTRVERMAAADDVVARRLLTVRLAALAFSGHVEAYAQLARDADLRWNDQRPASFVAALRGDAGAARVAFESYRGGLGSEHARQEPTDRILRATTSMFEFGPLALEAVEDIGLASTGHGAHPTGALLRIFRRICDGRWVDADTLLDRIPVWDDAYVESYGTLDVRLLHAALTRREPASRRRTAAAIRRLIGNGQLRHAVSPARWYVLALTGSKLPIEPDISAFVGNSLDVSPMPYAFAALPLATALLAPIYGDMRCASALASWPRFGSRWHRAHAELAHGMLSSDNERLRAARDAFDALGARAFAMIAGMALPVPRARDTALARRNGYGAVLVACVPILSPRERAIAEFAAYGSSNREIAAKLGVSERTVETHLTNAYRKLGVRSRTQLATRISS